MRVLCAFSPSLVLLLWAGFEAIGCDGVLITVTGLVLLVVALAFDVRSQRRHHAL